MPTHNDGVPRVNLCGKNLTEMLYRLKLLFSLPLLLKNVGDVLGLIVGRDAHIPPRLPMHSRMLTAACGQAALQHLKRLTAEQ